MFFADRIITACRDKDSRLVVGLDPHWDLINAGYKARFGEDNVEEILFNYLAEVVTVTRELAVAYKPQIAFFEQFGLAGMSAFSRLLKHIHDLDEIVITDAKRGDIGSTAAAYARAFFGDASQPAAFPSDALTVNGYLGSDGVKPFLKSGAHGIFVLVKTSNPSSGELQDLTLAEGESVAARMAGMVNEWTRQAIGSSGYGNAGAVIGATYPDHMRALRSLLPASLLLVPGYGAQGGAEEAVSAAFDKDGLGALINSSRGILFPAQFGNQGFDAVVDAAASARQHINRLAGQGKPG